MQQQQRPTAASVLGNYCRKLGARIYAGFEGTDFVSGRYKVENWRLKNRNDQSAAAITVEN
jgi:hypothetical protein